MTENSHNSSSLNRNHMKKWLGLALIALSFIFYGGLFLVPFVPFSAENKIVLSSLLVISGEASFWIGAVILGKEAVSKYRNTDWKSKAVALFRIFGIGRSNEEEKKEGFDADCLPLRWIELISRIILYYSIS